MGNFSRNHRTLLDKIFKNVDLIPAYTIENNHVQVDGIEVHPKMAVEPLGK